jgi:hypothetical protein
MGYLSDIILGIVAFWALGLVTWTMRRANVDNNRQLDCIMALVDKEKAVISASIGQVRTRSNGKVGSDAVDAQRTQLVERRKKLNKIHDEMNEAGVISPEQEAELAKYANLS